MTADADDDGDAVADSADDFPLDLAASLDTDGDGAPDDWNTGYSAGDSTTGLSIDLDDDGDGVPDIDEVANGTNPLLADSDGDTVSDLLDAFPKDPDRSEAGAAGAEGFKLPSTITVLKTEE